MAKHPLQAHHRRAPFFRCWRPAFPRQTHKKGIAGNKTGSDLGLTKATGPSENKISIYCREAVSPPLFPRQVCRSAWCRGSCLVAASAREVGGPQKFPGRFSGRADVRVREANTIYQMFLQNPKKSAEKILKCQERTRTTVDRKKCTRNIEHVKKRKKDSTTSTLRGDQTRVLDVSRINKFSSKNYPEKYSSVPERDVLWQCPLKEPCNTFFNFL